MKKLSNLFGLLAIICSHIMCIHVSYNYCSFQWGIQYLGFSAPAQTALLLAIPYLALILLCIIAAVLLRRKK